MRRVLIDLSLMTLIGVVLAIIGPFGSFGMPLAWRLVYWLGLAYAGYAIYRPIGGLIGRLEHSLALPAAGLWVAAVVVATVPMTAVVLLLGSLPGPLAIPSAQVVLGTYASVFVIGAAVTALFYALQSGKTAQPALADRPATAPRPAPEPEAPGAPRAIRFLDRLPPELGSDLIALEMEDHYVRAHTALGSGLVLLRLSDALAELGAVEGMQVHRSWWVARHAVKDVARHGRNVRLVLDTGIEAPVSRANVSVLRDAGWI
jgi:hypothetical protein